MYWTIFKCRPSSSVFWTLFFSFSSRCGWSCDKTLFPLGFKLNSIVVSLKMKCSLCCALMMLGCSLKRVFCELFHFRLRVFPPTVGEFFWDAPFHHLRITDSFGIKRQIVARPGYNLDHAWCSFIKMTNRWPFLLRDFLNESTCELPSMLLPTFGDDEPSLVFFIVPKICLSCSSRFDWMRYSCCYFCTSQRYFQLNYFWWFRGDTLETTRHPPNPDPTMW